MKKYAMGSCPEKKQADFAALIAIADVKFESGRFLASYNRFKVRVTPFEISEHNCSVSLTLTVRQVYSFYN